MMLILLSVKEHLNIIEARFILVVSGTNILFTISEMHAESEKERSRKSLALLPLRNAFLERAKL